MDGCQLCAAERVTAWHYEDDDCWVADCLVCATPMIVWRTHGLPDDELEALLLARLARVAEERYPPGHRADGAGDGGRVRVSAARGVAVTHDGEPVSDLELRSDRPGPPTILRVGTLSFYVIERDGDLAVRMKDSENPARQAFRGIESYAVD